MARALFRKLKDFPCSCMDYFTLAERLNAARLRWEAHHQGDSGWRIVVHIQDMQKARELI